MLTTKNLAFPKSVSIGIEGTLQIVNCSLETKSRGVDVGEDYNNQYLISLISGEYMEFTIGLNLIIFFKIIITS